ncbi:MAG: hypothetical protein GY810_32415 [Aureispira sp.]|nr:hypothetical protein [Aureispira sp.]
MNTEAEAVNPDYLYICKQDHVTVDKIKADVVNNDAMYDETWVIDPRWVISYRIGEYVYGETIIQTFGNDYDRIWRYFNRTSPQEERIKT